MTKVDELRKQKYEELKESVMIEASRRYPSSGYGQSEFYDVAMDMLAKKVREYRDDSGNYCHDCGKQNVNDIITMITGKEEDYERDE